MTTCIDRRRELAAIRDRLSQPSSLSLLYGQRRVGKSFLVRAAFEGGAGKRLCFQADESATGALLGRFVWEAEAAGLLPPGVRPPDWSTSLTLLSQQAALNGEPTWLLLDEFQYLVDADPSLPSVVQRVVDQLAQRSRLHLILCGSALGTMRALGDASQPLHGRFDLQLKLLPFTYREVHEFVPTWSRPDAVRAFGVFGGLARHLAMIDPSQSLERNIVTRLLDPLAALAEAPVDQLRAERIGSRRDADAVLEAIALGENQFGLIAARTGLTAQQLDVTLRELVELEMVRKERRYGDGPGARFVRYRPSDPFTGFWFRLVRSSRSLSFASGPEVAYAERVGPRLPDHMGHVFEVVVRDALLAGRAGFVPDEVAPYWSRDGRTEIDWVVRSGSRVLLVECKWREQGPVGLDALRQLRDHASRCPHGSGAELCLASATGFTPELETMAGIGEVLLIGPDTLFGG